MRKWGCAIFMAMVACAGAPAAWASDDGSVAFSDPCGDNHAFVKENDIKQEIPATPRTARYDIKGVRIAPTASGVAVSVTVCDAIGDPDGFLGWRGAYPWVSDDCQLAIVAQESAVPTQPRTPHFMKTCWGGADHGVPPVVSDTSDNRFDIVLPANAVTVSGDTLTITVNRAGMTGEAAAALAPGTVWKNLLGYAAENTWVAGGGGDPAGNGSFLAPTGMDFAEAATGATFTVQ